MRPIPLAVLVLSCRRDGPADDTDRVPASTGQTGDTGTLPDPDTVPLAGPCPSIDASGGFSVVSDALIASVSGAVADGVVPLTVMDTVQAEGDCALLRRVAPFCDPPCGPDEVCGLDAQCAPYPSQQDLGTVDVEGLVEPVSMEPSSPGNNYYAVGLPAPPWEVGALVTLRAAGADLPGFVLHGVGIAPLVLVPGEWVLTEGQPMEVRWEGAEGRATVHLVLTIDQHGATPLQLVCDFADTGSGTVPDALGAAFVQSGVTGFPSAVLTRRTVDSTTLSGGCVDFALEWSETGEVEVTGHAPCTSQKDCPKGQICNTALEICE